MQDVFRVVGMTDVTVFFGRVLRCEPIVGYSDGELGGRDELVG